MKKYSFDTNALIEPWNKYYTLKIVSDYWDILDNLAKEKIIFCSIQVKYEIDKIDDKLKKWVSNRPYLFREVTDEVNQHLRDILASHPELVDSKRGRSLADPWVIAHALAENAVVVTKEGLAPKKVHIPDVCRDLGVQCISDHDFVNEIGIEMSAIIK